MDSKLQQWVVAHGNLNDDRLWAGPFGAQLEFLRASLCYVIASGLKELSDVEKIPDVVGTHHSKSILLPVVEYSRPDLGLRLVVRGNFHNWALSVESERRIEANFSGLFGMSVSNGLSHHYFEGFPRDRIYGPYAKDNRKFSAHLGDDYTLYTTVFLIMRALGVAGS